MPRQARKHSGTGVYHVMLRGINRQDIFEDDEDYRQMVTCLRYYFVVLLRYIHQNPVKSAIVETAEAYPWSSWNEYLGKDILGIPLCAVPSVLARIDRCDLTEWVNTPVDDYKDILDIDTEERQSLSDDDIRTVLLNTYGIANPLMVQNLEKLRRNYVLKSVKDIGAGIRQLARLTGVSFGVIQKL